MNHGFSQFWLRGRYCLQRCSKKIQLRTAIQPARGDIRTHWHWKIECFVLHCSPVIYLVIPRLKAHLNLSPLPPYPSSLVVRHWDVLRWREMERSHSALHLPCICVYIIFRIEKPLLHNDLTPRSLPKDSLQLEERDVEAKKPTNKLNVTCAQSWGQWWKVNIKMLFSSWGRNAFSAY